MLVNVVVNLHKWSAGELLVVLVVVCVHMYQRVCTLLEKSMKKRGGVVFVLFVYVLFLLKMHIALIHLLHLAQWDAEIFLIDILIVEKLSITKTF